MDLGTQWGVALYVWVPVYIRVSLVSIGGGVWGPVVCIGGTLVCIGAGRWGKHGRVAFGVY